MLELVAGAQALRGRLGDGTGAAVPDRDGQQHADAAVVEVGVALLHGADRHLGHAPRLLQFDLTLEARLLGTQCGKLGIAVEQALADRLERLERTRRRPVTAHLEIGRQALGDQRTDRQPRLVDAQLGAARGVARVEPLGLGADQVEPRCLTDIDADLDLVVDRLG